MSLDFETIRRRLAEAEHRLSGAMSETEKRRLLEERAERLAGRHAVEVGAVVHRVFEVRRGPLVLGLPVETVEEIAKVHPTPLPRGTRVLQALFQIRGRVHCLADPASLLDPTLPQPAAGPSLVALIRASRGPLGLRIDAVSGTRELRAEDCLDHRDDGAPSFVRAVTRDLLHVLDIEALVARPEIFAYSPGVRRSDPALPDPSGNASPEDSTIP